MKKLALINKKAKRNKYGACAVVVNGERFASKREYNRWLELKEMLKNGKILQLQRQIKHPLKVNGKLICSYIADAVYVERGPFGSVRVVEDVKSKATMTPTYRIKKKLMKAIYGIEIKEVF